MAWPAFVVLVATGIWNVTAVLYSSQGLGLEGGADGQDPDRDRGGRRRLLAPTVHHQGPAALWGSVGGSASVAALVMGVLLAG
jgi:hypothetical protein